MNETLFYVLGIGLAVFAVTTSFVGLRVSRFPGSNAAMLAVILCFAALVGGTATFAVLHAKDEHAHDEGEIHKVEEESEAAHAQEAQ